MYSHLQSNNVSPKGSIKIVDSCRIFFENTIFRYVSVYGKDQESRKKNIS